MTVPHAEPVNGLPAWWEPLLSRPARAYRRLQPPAPRRRRRPGQRRPGAAGRAAEPGRPDVLVLQRAATLRNHAGQPAFPGGVADPGTPTPPPPRCARRPRRSASTPPARPCSPQLPELWIPVSDFVVTPVLAWWHGPHPVHPREPAEVAHVARLPVAELVDPANRLRVRHPSGWIGPAFEVRGMLVWGFTAGVLATLLEMAGWARPWSQDRMVELPPTAPNRLRPRAPTWTTRRPELTDATATGGAGAATTQSIR